MSAGAAQTPGAGRLRQTVEARAGGPARSRVVVVFAGVLALNTADLATVGAVAGELRADLHISNAQIGLLAAAPSIAAAVAALPLGVPNPPVDAARLDIVAGGLWGRAESVRTVLRTTAQALPLPIWRALCRR